jgi:hypothetical protein
VKRAGWKQIAGRQIRTVVNHEPIPVDGVQTKKEGAPALTRLLEERVQALLDKQV